MTRELARRDGLFGPIRVLERKSDGARLYCINGSVQTLMLPDGVSTFGYVHAAKLLVANAHDVLIIGGGGGSLATMLARRGHRITVLDIDPAAEPIAREYFALHESVHWVTADPISFIESYHGAFDAVIIDACDSQGLVSPFNKPQIIANVLAKTCPRGSLILNVVCEDGAPSWGGWMAAKLASLGLSVCLYRSEEGWEGNEVLHVRAEGPTDQLTVTDLERRPPEARTYLMSLRPHVPGRGRSRQKRKYDAES
ncbi:MAG: methyltransferase domain-containing protein [Hyphomonadaceae bacterium]